VNSLDELLNCDIRGLDCQLLQQSSEYMSIIYTCNTYFQERVIYQKVMLLYITINNICPAYLKKNTMSHILLTYHVDILDLLSITNILLTYHVDILDLLSITNYIRQNLTANRKSCMYLGAAIWNSLTLHVKNATSANTFKSLYLKWKRLNAY